VDCYNYKQNWQSFLLISSYLLYYDQYSGSTLTELVSCSNASYRPPWFGKLPPHVHSITVEDFQSRPELRPHGKESPYWPYNKPLALQQWIASGRCPDADGDYIVVIDPDFMFLRPLSAEFMNITENQIISAFYAIGGWWKYRVIGAICAQSPVCSSLSAERREAHLVGVPNVMHASTLRRIAKGWLDYTLMIHSNASIESWSDEQYAYIFAVVMQGIEHIRRSDLMVSHAVPEWGEQEWIDRTPHYFIHYCQSYKVGEWHWNKHDFHQRLVFQCETPPMPLVPNVKSFARYGWFGVVITQNFNSAWLLWKRLFC
jgi:hypothetical protein